MRRRRMHGPKHAASDEKLDDVREQTGWEFAHVRFIIERLGYGPVTEEIDRTIADGESLEALRVTLGTRAARRAPTLAAVCRAKALGYLPDTDTQTRTGEKG